MSCQRRRITIMVLILACVTGTVFYSIRFFNRPTTDKVDEITAVSEMEPTSFASAVSDFVVQRIRQQRENQLLQTDLSEKQLIARFLDESMPLATRKLDARRLAVLDSEKARAALLSVLQSGDRKIRAAVAEMLGYSRWEEVRTLLSRLLTEPDQLVAGGAVAGLVLLGDDQAVRLLRETLFNPDADPSVRHLIAWRLADVQSRAALEALKSAFMELDLPSEIRQQLIVSLGRFPFSQTAEVFRNVVDNPTLDSEFRTAATEALIDAGQSALPFLTDLASRHSDAEVRASAAWALGMHPQTGNLGEQLAASVKNEVDADVRRRLYESLMRQDQIPVDQLLEHALNEEDIASRVAAANMLAVAVGQISSSRALQQRFDAEAVPNLQNIALGNQSLNIRYRAVFALARAGTESALSALQEIERQGEPQVAALAARNVARHN